MEESKYDMVGVSLFDSNSAPDGGGKRTGKRLGV